MPTVSASSYHITAANDGSGNYTLTARRGGTAASGGTTLSFPKSALFPDASQITKVFEAGINAALQACRNDQAAGN